MIRALVVSSTAFKSSALFGPVTGLFADEVACARGADARRQLSSDAFDLIVINAPLADEYGSDLAVYAAEKTSAGILLFVSAQEYGPIETKVSSSGVIVVAKPCSVAFAAQYAKVALATEARMAAMKRTIANLQKKIAEVKIVERAKCALAVRRGMSEEDAHRYIEKSAMDSRMSRMEVAEEILRKFEH